ncbi:unnamed protein product, partial [Oppiella nova]
AITRFLMHLKSGYLCSFPNKRAGKHPIRVTENQIDPVLHLCSESVEQAQLITYYKIVSSTTVYNWRYGFSHTRSQYYFLSYLLGSASYGSLNP